MIIEIRDEQKFITQDMFLNHNLSSYMMVSFYFLLHVQLL